MGVETLTWEEREIYKLAMFQEELEIKSIKENENEIKEPNHQL